MATSDWYSDPLAGSGGIATIEDAGSGLSQNGLTKATQHVTVDGGTIIVTSGGSTTLYDGSQATSTAAAALNSGTSQAISEVMVQNRDATIAMLVGNATSQSISLLAGAAVVIPVSNLNKVYVKSASGTPTVAWLGRN